MESTVKVVLLEDWSVGWPINYDGYSAPEVVGRALQGIVKGHPRKADGERVITSNIVKASGRFVTTETGTIYHLGAVEAKYARWCAERGKPINPLQPIEVKKA